MVGLLQDEVDPMVSVMKVEKAPLESYADVGGLDAQIQEIKEAVELPLTHPELYEDIGIKPPKGVILYGEPGTGKPLLAKVHIVDYHHLFSSLKSSSLRTEHTTTNGGLSLMPLSSTRSRIPFCISLCQVL